MTSSTLKIIACISMLIDHIGVILFPEIAFLRIVGRLAFPIFTFLIVEGYFYTKNISKYLFRLGVFAVVSEFAFDRAFFNVWLEFEYQNIFFTLLIGLIAVYIYDHNKDNNKTVATVSLLALTLLSLFIKSDYSIFGVLTIFGFYQFREKPKQIFIWMLVINGIMVSLKTPPLFPLTLSDITQIFALLSLIFIFSYNGKKGLNLKYLFYTFYPLHLIILYGISLRI